jgi:integrase
MKHQTDRNRPRSGRHALTLRRAVWTHPHELRHTAASLAVAAGANVKAVQQMLGHCLEILQASAGQAGTVFLIAVDRRSGHAVTNDAAG